MLDTLFQRSHHVRRLRANPLGAILDQFADYLLRRGYTADFVHQLVRAAEHYGYWLGTRHAVVTADHVTRASARHFLHDHLATCSCPARLPARASTPAGRRSTICCGCSTSETRLGCCHRRLRTIHSWPSTTRSSGRPAGSPAIRASTACGTPASSWSDHFGEGPPDPDRLRPADLQDYFRRHAGHLSPDRSPSWRARYAASFAS